MIWIKNHGIRGESDNLRLPLSNEVDSITAHKDDPEASPAVIKLRRWTGVNISDSVEDVRDGFERALGPQIRFAADEPADHPDYESTAEELDDYYAGSHPLLDTE